MHDPRGTTDQHPLLAWSVPTPPWSEIDRDPFQLPIAEPHRIAAERILLRPFDWFWVGHRRVGAEVRGRLYMVGALAHRDGPSD
ncbi:hypothetical protein SPHINGO8AM_20100 [Sphingomonas sp. 8AM]|nr:hypothetical protein SPHINGO8AM_20100 [Sphingomonas sp. 8AM]